MAIPMTRNDNPTEVTMLTSWPRRPFDGSAEGISGGSRGTAGEGKDQRDVPLRSHPGDGVRGVRRASLCNPFQWGSGEGTGATESVD